MENAALFSFGPFRCRISAAILISSVICSCSGSTPAVSSERVATAATQSLSSTSVQTPTAALLFLDDFEYTVTRTDAGAASVFRQHGWSGVKSMQSSPRANGYLYTATSVPGSTQKNPGRNSTHVLVIESLAQQLGLQTDFYLQYGVAEESSYDNFIPGNVWIQFWLYQAFG